MFSESMPKSMTLVAILLPAAAGSIWLLWLHAPLLLLLSKAALLFSSSFFIGSFGIAWLAARSDALSSSLSSSRAAPIVPLLLPATLSYPSPPNDLSSTSSIAARPLARSVHAFVRTIVDLYLRSWYCPAISPSNESFPLAVERCIEHALAQVGARAARKEVDWADVGVRKVLPRITEHLRRVQLARETLEREDRLRAVGTGGPAGQKRPQLKALGSSTSTATAGKNSHDAAHYTSGLVEEYDARLASAYASLLPSGALHPALYPSSRSGSSEETHLRSLSSRLLSIIMPESERNSRAVMTMATEIVGQAVLKNVLDTVGEPDAWNKVIEEKAGQAIQEREKVNNVIKLLGSMVDSTPTAKLPPEPLSMRSSTRQFESIMRSLSRSPNLVEAKRLRNDIEVSLRQARRSAPAEDKSLQVKYISRLAQAKQAIDKRIVELGGVPAAGPGAGAGAGEIELDHVLGRDSPGLGFFIELMDRRKRTALVNFYTTVAFLKAPLEEDSFASQGSDPLASAHAGAGETDTLASAALKSDISGILEDYVRPARVSIDPSLVLSLEAFCAGSGDSEPVAARRALFAAQRQVYEDMLENDWPAFKKSDLYNLAAAQMPPRIVQSGLPTSPQRRPAVAETAVASLGRPAPFKRAGTAVLGVHQPATRPTDIRRRNTDLALFGSSGGPALRSGSDKLDFLTGGQVGPSTVANTDYSPLFKEIDSPRFASGADSLFASLDEADDLEQQRTMDELQDAISQVITGTGAGREGGAAKSPSPEEGPSPETSQSLRSASVASASGARRVSPRAVTPAATSNVDDKRTFWHPRTASGEAEATTSAVTATAAAAAVFDDASEAHLSGDELSSSISSLQARLMGAHPDEGQRAAPEPEMDVEKLAERLEKLKKQETVLADLLRKKELTGKGEEVKILRKSMDTIVREVEGVTRQKELLLLQSGAASGPVNRLIQGKTTVSIANTVTEHAGTGKEFVLYIVQVDISAAALQSEGADEAAEGQAVGWLVSRRYSEFVALHSVLRERFPAARALDLPPKRLMASSTLIAERRPWLERYLRSLIALPGACDSTEIQAFLSQQSAMLAPKRSGAAAATTRPADGLGTLRLLFRSLTDGLESTLTGAAIGVISRAADVAASLSAPLATEDPAPFPAAAAAAGASTSYAGHILEFIDQVFFSDGSSWARRHTLATLLQTAGIRIRIEQTVRDMVAVMLRDDGAELAPLLDAARESIWPHGKARPQSAPRSPEEKELTRISALRKVKRVVPALAASLLGPSNTKEGITRVFGALQNKRLNQHIIYTLLDEILDVIFGDDLKQDQ